MKLKKDTKVICPTCRANTVRRSHMSGFLERGILRSIGIRAFRCEVCDARFYGHGHGHSEPVEETVVGTTKK
jgi:ribosomal protein L37AE/L43A